MPLAATEKQESTEERSAIEEFTDTEDAIQEKVKESIEFMKAKRAEVEEKPTDRSQSIHTDEANVENEFEAKPGQDSTISIEDRFTIEKHGLTVTKTTELMNKTEERKSEILNTLSEERVKSAEEELSSIEKSTYEQSITNEVTATEGFSAIDEDNITTNQIVQKDESSAMEEMSVTTEEKVTLKEMSSIEERVKEPSAQNTADEELDEIKSEIKLTQERAEIIEQNIVSEEEKPMVYERTEETISIQVTITTEEEAITIESVPSSFKIPNAEEILLEKEPVIHIDENIPEQEVVRALFVVAKTTARISALQN